MTEHMTPTEERLWRLALACTNSVEGGARVVASIVRDVPSAEKVSDARLAREVVERSHRWLEQSFRDGVTPGDFVSEGLRSQDCHRRALVWLVSVEGGSLLSAAWAIGQSPEVTRDLVASVDRSYGGGLDEAVRAIRRDVGLVDQSSARGRLDEARALAEKRDRKSATVMLVVLVLFALVTGSLVWSLLHWEDASQVLGPGTGAESAVPAESPEVEP